MVKGPKTPYCDNEQNKICRRWSERIACRSEHRRRNIKIVSQSASSQRKSPHSQWVCQRNNELRGDRELDATVGEFYCWIAASATIQMSLSICVMNQHHTDLSPCPFFSFNQPLELELSPHEGNSSKRQCAAFPDFLFDSNHIS
jgi:hypothetical protein